MKRLILRALILLAAGGMSEAKAADYSYPPPPPPVPYRPGPYTVSQPLDCYSWAGPYIGGNLGYNWGSISGNPTQPSGFSGGIQGGYNFQPGNGPWVFGI